MADEARRSPARERRRVIAEVSGLGGVGKSTLASLVVTELRARGVPTRQLPETRASAKAAMAARAACAWLRACAWLGPRRLRRARRGSLGPRLWRYLKRMEFYCRHDGVHIVDGGLTRLLMTLHMTGAHTDLLAAWRGLAVRLPTPDLIVLIDASDEDIARRRAARAAANDRSAPRPTRAERDALRSLRAVLAEVDAARGAPFLIVVQNGRGEEQEAAMTIADAIVDDLTGSRSTLSGR